MVERVTAIRTLDSVRRAADSTGSASFGPLLDAWWSDTPGRYGGAVAAIGRSARTDDREDFWHFQLGQGVDDPAKLSRDDINRWTDNLTSRARRDGRAGGLTGQTVAILWRNARPFFAWWASEEDAPNPFANADRPPEGDRSPAVIHLDDIRALIAACKGREFEDLRDEAIIRVLFDTGTRLGELAGIQLTDWDRRQDFLLVDGKTGPRLVPMSASTAEAVARYVRRARGRHVQADLPALWLGRRGALAARGIQRVLDRRCDQAGIGHINPHRFRHTFAHEFRMHGGDDGQLQYLAGWKSAAMPARYGRSAAGQRARKAHQAIGLGDLI
jgi:site-specific recombinase XerD